MRTIIALILLACLAAPAHADAAKYREQMNGLEQYIAKIETDFRDTRCPAARTEKLRMACTRSYNGLTAYFRSEMALLYALIAASESEEPEGKQLVAVLNNTLASLRVGVRPLEGVDAIFPLPQRISSPPNVRAKPAGGPTERPKPR